MEGEWIKMPELLNPADPGSNLKSQGNVTQSLCTSVPMSGKWGQKCLQHRTEVIIAWDNICKG